MNSDGTPYYNIYLDRIVEKVSLITKTECEESKVSKKEAEVFIAEEIPAKTEPESEPSGVDAEDLLDEI